MEKIILGVRSVLQAKMRAIVFCGTSPDKYEWIKRQLRDVNVRVVEDKKEDSTENDRFDLRLVARVTRREDTQRAVELIPSLDAFVAASHERINYAVGLGMPMFVLFPLIGTFASQNFEFARRQMVVYPLNSPEKAQGLGEILGGLRRSGELALMAKSGWGHHNTEGTHTAVAGFLECL
jgi:hypothetical protein